MTGKWTFLALVMVIGVGADFWTKRWALAGLDFGVTEYAWNGILKLTLSYNRGAAFGLHLGEWSRLVFIVFTLVTVTWLIGVYRRTVSDQRMRRLGIAFVCAGALGNLIDRVASASGVVDFLGPYDLGFMMWPIFNVADILVVAGIIAIMISLRAGQLHQADESAVNS